MPNRNSKFENHTNPKLQNPASIQAVGGLGSLLGRTLVLVAHPDDESVGCGALLQRIREPVVMFATDGAPRDEFFWGKYGSRLRYARVRQEEACAALALAGVNEIVFLAEDAGDPELFVDQELYRAIPQALDAIARALTRYRPDTVLTLAYEGGHPDHDVCSFLAAFLQRQFGFAIWEFPLYHRLHSRELVFQRFVVPSEREETVLEIMPEELEIKRQMLAAYPSQHPFLLEFNTAVERFRPQHIYDYSRPPHVGALNYEFWGWPVTGTELCAAFTSFLETRRRRVI